MSEPLPFPEEERDPTSADLVGTLVGITYRNDDNGYTVARLEVDDQDKPVPLVGTMPGVEVGDTLRVTGAWTTHPQYGPQVDVSGCEVRPPTGRKGLMRFLGGGRLKGVGPKTAEKIVDALGLDVLERLERNPSLLATVSGISATKARGIMLQLDTMREEQAALAFLFEHGLGQAHAVKVFKRYGERTVELVRENPYRLADEVFGIGFRTADGVARSMGHDVDSSFRLTAGLEYLLGRAAMEGHVGLPSEAVCERGAAFLEVDEQRLESVLVDGLEAGRFVEDGLVYRPDLHDAEDRVAEHVRRLVSASTPPDAGEIEEVVSWAEGRAGFELSDDQREALRGALASKLSVVTGGPGVGKTTLVRCLVDVFIQQGRTVALAAPTGRAARRLEQATGHPASTLHRLLGITPGLPRRNDEPLDAHVLIVDEASMVDITLLATVLGALADSTALVLVGDVDQLPSVGPGEILRAFIASDLVPVSRLRTIFRQGEHSGIVRVSHEINEGRMPEFDERPDGQAFFVERNDPAEVLTAIRQLLTQRIPRAFGLDPLRDVQVLTPMHRGPVGTQALNEGLRATLNPPGPEKPELTRFGKVYRLGDKVMQTRNNYDLDVFNGDIGLLVAIDEDAGTATVEFDGRSVQYPGDQVEQLEPAFAITCHKSQGSEFPAVLLPLVPGQFMMLRRNLVYTAFTRARRLLVALGDFKALQTAVSTVDTGTRHGRLAERLAGDAVES